MIVLGIDPGSSLIGYALLKKQKENNNIKVIDFGCISLKKEFSEFQKLKQVYKKINHLIKKYKPNIISIEKMFFFKNLKTAIPVSQTRGVILLTAILNKKRVLEFTPLQLKTAIAGYGRADKKQIQKMIKASLNLNQFNFQKKYRNKDDAYDALGIALCAFLYLESKLCKTRS